MALTRARFITPVPPLGPRLGDTAGHILALTAVALQPITIAATHPELRQLHTMLGPGAPLFVRSAGRPPQAIDDAPAALSESIAHAEQRTPGLPCPFGAIGARVLTTLPGHGCPFRPTLRLQTPVRE